MADFSLPESGLHDEPAENSKTPEEYDNEIRQIRAGYEARLVVAHLRTEAIRAGMVDLDGLKLIDASALHVGPDDRLIGSRDLMEGLKRSKPWLFGSSSSSSIAGTPNSKPIRQKTALDMTEEEYAVARLSLTKRRY